MAHFVRSQLSKIQVNLLPEEIPNQWYNILADLAEIFPNKAFPQPQGDTASLSKVLVQECLRQEMAREHWIDIPEELWLMYQKIGRPRPLFRASGLEKALGLPSGIELWYKFEGASPPGSHKLNTALAQVYFAKQEGVTRVVTETGAGQWGSSVAYAASLLGLKATVYWVRAVYQWKKDRLSFMRDIFGAEVYASPSRNTESGRQHLAENKKHPGSLAIAISEGLEDAASDPSARYVLGSVLNHVLLHQTLIGLETKQQLRKVYGDKFAPDIVISCLGGGSNFGGLAIPFMQNVLYGWNDTRFVIAQSASAPNLTKGEYKYDHADHAEKTPQFKALTLGHQANMPPIKGDGIRYHMVSPLLSFIIEEVKRPDGRPVIDRTRDIYTYPADELDVFERAKLFVRTEGWLPAPESLYSVAAAIDEALKCREAGEKKVIVFNISGHGLLDIDAYRKLFRELKRLNREIAWLHRNGMQSES